MEFKSLYQLDYIKLLEGSIKSEEELKAQYQKELVDAENGTGLCAGMDMYMRNGISRELRSHIMHCDQAIDAWKKQIEEERNVRC